MSVKTLFPKKSTSEVLGIKASEYLFFVGGGHGSIHNILITNTVIVSRDGWNSPQEGNDHHIKCKMREKMHLQ